VSARRKSGYPTGARQPAGGNPDGHQSARHKWYRSPENPARRSGNGAHPVVALSCQRHAARRREGLAGRVFRYLTKPIRSNEFCRHWTSHWNSLDRRTVAPGESGRQSWFSQADILNARILVVERPGPMSSCWRHACASPATFPSSPQPSERGLRTSPQEPLRPDPARSANAGMDGFQVMEA